MASKTSSDIQAPAAAHGTQAGATKAEPGGFVVPRRLMRISEMLTTVKTKSVKRAVVSARSCNGTISASTRTIAVVSAVATRGVRVFGLTRAKTGGSCR